MSAPLPGPKRKNPLLQTRLPVLPPSARSRVGLGLTAAAAEGRFELQVCSACGATQYPPREACSRCLCSDLKWTLQDGRGELISDSVLHTSHDLYFRERLPWRLGTVRLACGAILITHLHGDVPAAPAQVRVAARLDKSSQAALIALPVMDTANMSDDRQLREMTCDPKFRKILVTDGKTSVGQELVKAVIAAGADLVWVGCAEPWKQLPGLADITALPQVTALPLDLTNSESVKQLAAQIGAKVDIVINNAEVHRTHGISSRQGVDVARAEMDVNYFGFLRLAQEFGSVMRARGADGQSGAVAWVNLLSIYALTNFPPHGTFSASKAAALSLAQCLRAEMQPAAIRVINAFPGPIDDEWNQLVPPPKLAPRALAQAIVGALQNGTEDIYPGDVAQEWRARWRENPKILERELAQNG
jgi:NAD(P)-dependent dehydrogenase (short-subunit alcohol dehydrogenase family)/uncharacterized OB-fold protein